MLKREQSTDTQLKQSYAVYASLRIFHEETNSFTHKPHCRHNSSAT